MKSFSFFSPPKANVLIFFPAKFSYSFQSPFSYVFRSKKVYFKIENVYEMNLKKKNKERKVYFSHICIIVVYIESTK